MRLGVNRQMRVVLVHVSEPPVKRPPAPYQRESEANAPVRVAPQVVVALHQPQDMNELVWS